MGLTLTAAFTAFAKRVAREKRIPFEVSADPFYDERNIRYPEKQMIDYIKRALAGALFYALKFSPVFS